jgi:hypothetical protein
MERKMSETTLHTSEQDMSRVRWKMEFGSLPGKAASLKKVTPCQFDRLAHLRVAVLEESGRALKATPIA